MAGFVGRDGCVSARRVGRRGNSYVGISDKIRMSVGGSKVTVSFPRRAHNPIFRSVPWNNLPAALLNLSGGTLALRFR